MTKDAYPALFHYIHKQIADVEFPTTKKDMLKQIEGRKVNVDWNQTVLLSDFVEPIPQESFSCAADFYCMMIAAM
ncbi:MAG TPA: hypothetical protein DCP22_02710 [Ruminococcaceae bacterium]|nr:hypothetical protein [Oscillospiraceae bacterium]